MDTEVVQAPKFRRPSFIRAVLRLRLGRAGFSVLLTWKVLFFEQDCQTGQDCRARNRFVLRNRPSLPVWLRPSGRAVKPLDKSQPKNKSGRSILTVPSLELNLEPPRAFPGQVSRSPSVGLPTQPPSFDQIELGWVFVGRLNRLFYPAASTTENRRECFGVMSCGRSSSIRTRCSGSG